TPAAAELAVAAGGVRVASPDPTSVGPLVYASPEPISERPAHADLLRSVSHVSSSLPAHSPDTPPHGAPGPSGPETSPDRPGTPPPTSGTACTQVRTLSAGHSAHTGTPRAATHRCTPRTSEGRLVSRGGDSPRVIDRGLKPTPRTSTLDLRHLRRRVLQRRPHLIHLQLVHGALLTLTGLVRALDE